MLLSGPRNGFGNLNHQGVPLQLTMFSQCWQDNNGGHHGNNREIQIFSCPTVAFADAKHCL